MRLPAEVEAERPVRVIAVEREPFNVVSLQSSIDKVRNRSTKMTAYLRLVVKGRGSVRIVVFIVYIYALKALFQHCRSHWNE